MKKGEKKCSSRYCNCGCGKEVVVKRRANGTIKGYAKYAIDCTRPKQKRWRIRAERNINIPCKDCGKSRLYSQPYIDRGEVRDFCHKCCQKTSNTGRVVRTKEERNQYCRDWYQANKKRVNYYYGEYREKIRMEMVEGYGGKCLHCGESDQIVLVLDHINNDGSVDRKLDSASGGFKLYARLRKEGWPKEKYQLLCHNCNFKKEYRRRKDAISLSETA